LSFWLLGLTVLLAVHFLASAGVSLAVAGVAGAARARVAELSAEARARGLFALLLLPSIAGLACVALAVVSWLLYEPRRTGERPGAALVTLAVCGLAVIVARGSAAAGDALRTRRVTALFRRQGREVRGLPLPASRAAFAFPVASLAGLWRPRLLFAEGVLSALEPDELDAVVAHELAHLRARDNLRRLLLRTSLDPLALTRLGRRLRGEFLGAAEAAADARACDDVAPTALARAIVKVARLVPAERLAPDLASVHLEGSLAARVHALVGRPQPEGDSLPAPHPRSAARLAMGLAAAALGFAGAAAALPALHEGLERLVRLLG
jgi:Zn-dependent protease with chaperone function